MKLLLNITVLLLLPAVLFAGNFFQPVPMADVARLMKRPGVAIIDVNVQELWEKHHIPGAIHIENGNLAKQLPVDKSTTLIFYCAGPLCLEGPNMATNSIMLGYHRVFIMTDGIFTWVKAGYPVEAAAPAKRHGTVKR